MVDTHTPQVWGEPGARPTAPPTSSPANRAPGNRVPAELRGTQRSGGGKSLGRQTHHWSRLIHVYTSMVALIVVLFFAISGLTLNNPSWTFGSEPQTTTSTGTFPFSTELLAADGSAAGVDFLSISEYVRDTYDVNGGVESFDATNGSGMISYRDPGYAADLTFDTATGDFDLTIVQEGWVAVIGDLHKGSSTGTAWKLVIDAVAVFLIVISVTGLVMQFFLKKRRRSAFVSVGAGAVVVAGFLAYVLLQ